MIPPVTPKHVYVSMVSSIQGFPFNSNRHDVLVVVESKEGCSTIPLMQAL